MIASVNRATSCQTKLRSSPICAPSTGKTGKTASSEVGVQALTPFDRQWNHDNEAFNEPIAESQWFKEQSEPRRQSWFPPSP